MDVDMELYVTDDNAYAGSECNHAPPASTASSSIYHPIIDLTDSSDLIPDLSNQPPVVINGITVSYPEGWGGAGNPEATIRRRVGIRWENIARLITNPTAWYDDSHIMLHMLLTVIHGGARAAVVDPLYTNLWQQDPAIRHRRLHRARLNPNTGVTEEIAMPVWNFTAGIMDNPDIIGIPINMNEDHWVLGIYTRADHTIRYYNTLWRPMTSTISDQLMAIVERFYPDEPVPTIHVVPTNEYNRQEDGYNCGPHCLLIWESFIMPNRSAFIEPLNMEHERLRMLSNLIAGFINDDQPYVPLHPNGEQYPSIEQYTIILPFRDTRDRPPHGIAEPEEEGDSIPHWHAEGIEIDPINLSPDNSHAFYTDTEVGAQKNAIAASIRDLCGTDMDRINSFSSESSTQGLHASLISTYLCMLTHLRKEKTSIVRTEFTLAYNSEPSTMIRASNFAYGDPSQANIILIPILKFPIQHTNDHSPYYILGMFNPKAGTLFHFDPLGTDASEKDKHHYRDAILTLRPLGEPSYTCKRVINRVKEAYNQHSAISMSGFYITLTAELILLRGYEHIYLKRLIPVMPPQNRRSKYKGSPIISH